MKRLGIYVITFIMLFAFFGGFVQPNTLYAEDASSLPNGTPCGKNGGVMMNGKCDESLYTEEIKPFVDSTDIAEIKKRAEDVLDSTIGSSLGSKPLKWKDDLRAELNTIATDELNKTPRSTYNQAAISIYRQFQVKIADKLNLTAVGSTDQDAIRRATGLMIDLTRTYENLSKVDSGLLTADQANKNIENSLNQTSGLKNADPLPPTTSNDLNKKDDIAECKWNSWTVGDCLGTAFTYIIKTWVLNVAGFLVWAASNLLNYSIQIGILNFKSWAPDSLYPIWIIIRQIVSLFVVFAGLWLGLMYIIDKGNEFQKFVPWLILFALFVNFSYPITRVFVDVSNVISLNIYASAVGGNVISPDPASTNNAGSLIMNRLGLNGLILSATEAESSTVRDPNKALTSMKTPGGALLAVAFVLYAAYIFFRVSILIIARTVALVFLIVASPLLLIDSVLPLLGEQAMKLRKIFLEQLIVGPVFMIMFALTLKFLDVFSAATKSTGAAFEGSIVEMFNLTMMLIMLHVMFTVTKSMSGKIGEAATNTVGTIGALAAAPLGGLAMRGAMAGSGAIGRHVIGKRAAQLANSDGLNSWAGKSGVTGFFGRHAMALTESVAGSSFDGRNSSIVQASAKRLGIGNGMGTGEKMGYEEMEELRQKNLKKHLGRVGTHKENVYENGKLVSKKGDVRNDAEAQKMRDDFIKDASSSRFAKASENADVKYSLGKEAENRTKEKGNEALAAYRKIDEDNTSKEATAKKAEFMANITDEAVKAKLAKYDEKVQEELTRKTSQEAAIKAQIDQAETAKLQVAATESVAKAQEASTKAVTDLAAILSAKQAA